MNFLGFLLGILLTALMFLIISNYSQQTAFLEKRATYQIECSKKGGYLFKMISVDGPSIFCMKGESIEVTGFTNP